MSVGHVTLDRKRWSGSLKRLVLHVCMKWRGLTITLHFWRLAFLYRLGFFSQGLRSGYLSTRLPSSRHRLVLLHIDGCFFLFHASFGGSSQKDVRSKC